MKARKVKVGPAEAKDAGDSDKSDAKAGGQRVSLRTSQPVED